MSFLELKKSIINKGLCACSADVLAEYTDLSFGDFWAFDYSGAFSQLERCTLVSQRTDVGIEILHEAEVNGAIATHILPKERMSRRILNMARKKKVKPD